MDDTSVTEKIIIIKKSLMALASLLETNTISPGTAGQTIKDVLKLL